MKEQNKMKKLMFAAVAVLAGIAANAASMNWGFDYSYASDGSGVPYDSRGTTATYIGYVFDAATYSYASAQSALENDKVSELIGNAVASSVMSDTDYGTIKDTSDFTKGGDGFAKAYIVMFDAATAADAKFAYITEVSTAEVPGSGAAGSFTFGEDGDLVGSADAANWTAVNVPEPTSGLLLLLGVAGLALRRRRA